MGRIHKVFCIGSTETPACVEATARVRDGLVGAGFSVLDHAAAEGGHPDAIVLLGGDGFLMEFLRTFRYPEAPIFGVNFGTVGSLMNSHQLVDELPALLREERFIEVRHSLLEARTTFVDGREETSYAFNEFVLERQTGQAVRLRVEVNGSLFNRFAGDGFVVSTPAGSTAYNLAAGGPAVHPEVESIILTPLYPHLAEPFHSVQFSSILPLSSRIAIAPEEIPKRLLRLVADGRPSRSVSSILIRDSGRKVTLLRTADREFTRLLSQKFIGQSRS